MAIKKTELYSSLWASCDELYSGMDARQDKDYILTLLFMKYVPDNYKGGPYGMIVKISIISTLAEENRLGRHD